MTASGNPQRVIPIKAVPAGADDDDGLFEVRRKIYPRALRGWPHSWFSGWRWLLVWATQLVFYGTPWLNWNGRQAVLFDLEARKFYIFDLILWPQDFIYLSILLILSALLLFFVTAIAGRLWCGFACPQTVYTEIFLWIERHIEGDRHQRMKLDARPLDADKLLRKTAKHGAWIALSLWTGVTFVGFFTPMRELVTGLVPGLAAQGAAPGPWGVFWILFYGFATYGNAGWMREQVCKYMCPYARFQSAMFDKDTLIVAYDTARGEPRGARSKKADYKALGLGTCIDCGVCVEVCPTGIDIRNGLQYECISCAACIDACDTIMDRMNYPRGLIRYASENAMAKGWDARQIVRRVLRPRVLIYGFILLALTVGAGVSLSLRVPLKLDVIRDRGVPRLIEDGGTWVENVYRLQVMNQQERPLSFHVEASGLPEISVVSGSDFEMAPATTRQVAVRVRARVSGADGPKAGSHPVYLSIVAKESPELSVREAAVFLIPRGD